MDTGMGNEVTTMNGLVGGGPGQNNATSTRKTRTQHGDLASKVAAEQEAALSPTARMDPAQVATWNYDHIIALENRLNALTDAFVSLQLDHTELVEAHNSLAEQYDMLVEAHNGLAVDVEQLETVPSSRRSRGKTEPEVPSEQ